MTKVLQDQYMPNYAVAPGETVIEALEILGLTRAELALHTNCSEKTINAIIEGTLPITPEIAVEFEKVLEVTADFWLRLEQQYREDLVRLQAVEISEAVPAATID